MTIVALTSGTTQPVTSYDPLFKTLFGLASELQVDAVGAFDAAGSGVNIMAFYDVAYTGTRLASIEIASLIDTSYYAVGWTDGVPGSGNGVFAFWEGFGTVRFYRFDAGVATTVGGSTTHAISVGDVLSIEFNPTTNIHQIRINGSTNLCPGPAADSTYNYSKAGFLVRRTAAISGRIKNFTVPSPLTIPGAPSNINFSAITSTSITANVSPVAGATSYTLEHAQANTGPWTVIGPQANTEFGVSGLTANTQYYWRATATNSAGTGPYSPIVMQGTTNPATGGGGDLSSSFAITSPSSFDYAELATGPIANLAVTGASGAVTWTKIGGADQAKFSLSTGGVLSPVSAFDFETPGSAASSNAYLVQVQVTDDVNTTTQTITVNVTNVAEGSIVSGPNQISVDPGGVTTVTGVVLEGSVPVPGATLTGTTPSPGIEVLPAPGGGGLTFLVSAALDVSFPAMVSLHYGSDQKDIQIVDLITGKLTSTISAVAVAIGQAVSLTVTVFTDNGATIEAGATVYARWANTALAAIGGWATQTSNGSGQATFTFTPTLSGESILVINAGARAISIPVKVRAVSAIAISPGYLSLSAGGSKPYYAVALDFSGAEISGLSLTITPSAGAPVVAAGSNPGVAIANVGAARGNYTIAFSSGSITANLDVSVRGSIALNTAPDISVGLASSIQIPRGDTVRAFMFDLEELNTPNPRIGASPSIRLSINNRAPVLASGQAIELGDGRYAWMPRIADVNEEGSMIVLIGESNSKPTTPISVEVVTPYGAR